MLRLKKEIYLKTISLITLCIFLVNTILSDAARAQGVPAFEQYAIGGFEIPVRFGSIEDVYNGTNGKIIIYIQDAHCNYSCQQSIKDLLEYLTDKYGFDLALLEGGSGDYDLSVFTDIKDTSFRERIADYFVKEGRVNGAEYFAINNPDKITLKGLEKKELYIKNLKAYRESLVYKDAADKTLKTIEEYFVNLKTHIYSAELKEFEQKKRDFGDKKIEIDEYLSFLAGLSGRHNLNISNHKNLYKLIEVIRQEEDIDFKKSNSEREQLIDELTKRLSSRELKTLVEKTIQFKRAEINRQEFYSYLLKKAGTADINADKVFPNLLKYKRYVEIYDSIHNYTLFNEIKKLEDDIAAELCENSTQKSLYTLSENLALLNKLFNITFTTDEYKYYHKNRHSFGSGRFLSFINDEIPKYTKADSPIPGNDRKSFLSFLRKQESKTGFSHNIKILDTYRNKMEKFYKLAFKRDNAFISNINAYAKNKDRLIVVSGGFHSKNLKNLLERKGYSYISVMPKLNAGEESSYFKLLSGGLIKEEKLITEAISSIALGSMFDDMQELPGSAYRSRLAVKLIEAADQNKLFILEKKDESGSFKGWVIYTRDTDGQYERKDINTPDEKNNFLRDTEPAEAVEVILSEDNTILAINKLSLPAGDEITADHTPDRREILPGYDEITKNLINNGYKPAEAKKIVKRAIKRRDKLVEMLSSEPPDLKSLIRICLKQIEIMAVLLGAKPWSKYIFAGEADISEKEMETILKRINPNIRLKITKSRIENEVITAINIVDTKTALDTAISAELIKDKKADIVNFIMTEVSKDPELRGIMYGYPISEVRRIAYPSQDITGSRIYEIKADHADYKICWRGFGGEETEKKKALYQAIADIYDSHPCFDISKRDAYESYIKFLQWIKSNKQNLILSGLGLVGILYLFPRVAPKIRQRFQIRQRPQYSRSIQQKEHREYDSKRAASRIIDPSLVPRPRHGETVIKKFPKNWNSNIDLSVTKSAGIGGTFPWDAPLANETIVAGIEGKIYGPLFKTIAFNFESNGEIVPPEDLTFVARGIPDGTKGTFVHQMVADGKHSVEPLAHLRGVIDGRSSIKIRPIDENGELLGNENVSFSLTNGRIINFDYTGRVRIEITVTNYSENVGIRCTQKPLPENELRDFPDPYAMDIIKYIREGLAGDEGCPRKFVELVDVDGMTLREKMDAIADGERSGFIPKWVKFQAAANIMWKYGFLNARDAEMEYNGISWGSTWDSDIENGQKSREICNTAVRRFVLLCQRIGLRAGYVGDPEGLAKKGNFIIKGGKIPHAMAVVEYDDETWELVEVTKLVPREPGKDRISSSGGSVFEGRAEYIRLCNTLSLKPDNHKEEEELRKQDTIMQELVKLKRQNNRDSAYWWLEMGRKYNEAGYWDEAVKYFTKGFRMDPNKILDCYYRYQFVKTCKNQGNLTTAIEYMQKYLEQNPKSKASDRMLDDLWELYQDDGDNEKAIDFFESFVEKDPGNASAWWILKKGYLKQAKKKGIEQSIKFLNKYLKKHPKSDKGLFTLRGICKEEDNIDSSIEEIKKLLDSQYSKRELKKSSKKPRPFWLYDVLGDLYVRRKLPHKAMAAYEQAFAFSPSKVKFWPRAGFELYNNGYFKQSVKAHEQAVRFEANQSDGNLWKYLGYSYRSTGDHDKAIEAYKKALGISVHLYFERRVPTLYVIYDLADIYKDHASGRIDEAIEYFTELSKGNPESPRIITALAKLYTCKGNYNKAIEAYDQGIRPILDKKYFSDEVEELAKIYIKYVPKRIDDGITYFEILHGKYPVHPGVNDALTSLYMAKKLFDKAIGLYKNRIALMLDEGRYDEYGVCLLAGVYLKHRKDKISEGIVYFGELLEKVSNEHKSDVIASIAGLYAGKQDFSNALLWYRKIMEPWKLEKEQNMKKSFEKDHLIRNGVQRSLPDSVKKPLKYYDNDDVLGFIDCLIGAKEYQEAKERCITYLRITRSGCYYNFAQGWERLRDIYKGLGGAEKAEMAQDHYSKYILEELPVPDETELEEILKKFDDLDDSETINKPKGEKDAMPPLSYQPINATDSLPVAETDTNVSCGTVCKTGHELCLGALDNQLEEFYTSLAIKADMIRDLEARPLTSDEVIDALATTSKIDNKTAGLLQEIKAHIEEKIPGIKERGIQLFFGIPKDNKKLWWVKDPKTNEWTYAGGHFNKKGTRIHISIPLILAQKNPKQAAEAIARHDYNHIIGQGHDDDEGMKIVRKAAESLQKKQKSFTKRVKTTLAKYLRIAPVSQEELLRRFKRALNPFDDLRIMKLIRQTRKLEPELALQTLGEMSLLDRKNLVRYTIEKEVKIYGAELDSIVPAYPRFGLLDPVLEDNGTLGESFRHILETNPSEFSKNLRRIIYKIGERLQQELSEEYGDNVSVAATLRGSGLKGYAHYMDFSAKSSDMEMCFIIWGIREYSKFEVRFKIQKQIRAITRDVLDKEEDRTTVGKFSSESTYIIYAEDVIDKVYFARPDVEEQKERHFIQGKRSQGGLGGLFTLPTGGPNWSNKIAMLFAPYLYVNNPEKLMELRCAIPEKIKENIKTTPRFNVEEIKNWEAIWPNIQEKWGWQINMDKSEEGRPLPQGRRILELPGVETVSEEMAKVLNKVRNRARLKTFPPEYKEIYFDVANRGCGYGVLGFIENLAFSIAERIEGIKIKIFVDEKACNINDLLQNMPEGTEAIVKSKRDMLPVAEHAVVLRVGYGSEQEIWHYLDLGGADAIMLHIPIYFAGYRMHPKTPNIFPRYIEKGIVHRSVATAKLRFDDSGRKNFVFNDKITEQSSQIEAMSEGDVVRARQDLVASLNIDTNIVSSEEISKMVWAFAYTQDAEALKKYRKNIENYIKITGRQVALFLIRGKCIDSKDIEKLPAVDRLYQFNLKLDYSKKNLYNRILLLTGSFESDANGQKRLIGAFPCLVTGDQSFSEAIAAKKLCLHDLFNVRNGDIWMIEDFWKKLMPNFIRRYEAIPTAHLEVWPMAWIDNPRQVHADFMEEVSLILRDHNIVDSIVDIVWEESRLDAVLERRATADNNVTCGTVCQDQADVKVQPVMGPSYITKTAEEILGMLKGTGGAERTSLMPKPCTVGMVIKADPDKDFDLILKENLANEWNIIARKVNRRIMIARGIKIGDFDITYVICIDDGTDASLDDFKQNLIEAGNPKDQTFAWILSAEKRNENNPSLQKLNKTAHLVALKGEYVPVSWQMLAGPLFADLIYSKTVSDGSPEFEERINALVGSIIRSVSLMTRRTFEEWDSSLGEELRRATVQDIRKLFNGVTLTLDLPPMEPLIHTIQEYQKADKEIQTAL